MGVHTTVWLELKLKLTINTTVWVQLEKYWAEISC